jgi:hypothetical protein
MRGKQREEGRMEDDVKAGREDGMEMPGKRERDDRKGERRKQNEG